MRIALILPVRSSRGAIAATGIVIGLLRSYGRVELRLTPAPTSPLGASRRAEFRQVLFVAVDLAQSSSDVAARQELEHTIRTQVERQYARQGITAVDYNLQIL